MNAFTKTAVDLAPWGYAPGTTRFYCGECDTDPNSKGVWPHLGHAHATRCEYHAVEARLRDLRDAEGSDLHLDFLEDPSPMSAILVTIAFALLAYIVAGITIYVL